MPETRLCARIQMTRDGVEQWANRCQCEAMGSSPHGGIQRRRSKLQLQKIALHLFLVLFSYDVCDLESLKAIAYIAYFEEMAITPLQI